MRVSDVMTRDPIYVEVPGSRDEVIKLMMKYKYSGYPVVDRNTKKLVGIITRKDLLNNPGEDQIALLMTSNPITTSPRESLKSAAKKMFKHNIHRLPVVDSKGSLVGIITDRDVIRYLVEKKIDVPVIEFMKSPCYPVYWETPANVLMEIVRVSKIYAFPVLDDNGDLVGIVTDRDLFSKAEIHDIIIGEKSIESDEDSWTWEGIRNVIPFYYITQQLTLPKKPIKEFMVKDVRTVFFKTPVWEAAEKMIQYDIDQMPVVDHHEKLIGMLTIHDLLETVIKY
ncbi:MAG TPA: CBS domain-containing protein [Euryarchaeota archaeon]|nr:CBS domain-containing protein [Euryarchaeota archaeon]